MDKNYTQLCVWPGTALGDSTPKEFEDFIKDKLHTRIIYHDTVLTKPDLDKNGKPVPDTGGRNDLFFYVHKSDIGEFAVSRLQAGIIWWEDVLGNGGGSLYTKEFLDSHPVSW